MCASVDIDCNDCVAEGVIVLGADLGSVCGGQGPEFFTVGATDVPKTGFTAAIVVGSACESLPPFVGVTLLALVSLRSGRNPRVSTNAALAALVPPTFTLLAFLRAFYGEPSMWFDFWMQWLWETSEPLWQQRLLCFCRRSRNSRGRNSSGA